VNQVTDVNDKTNIAGAGINVAQRVMDCGDAGHILLSGHLAEDLTQYRHWQPYLHDLGECEVKHGLRLHLFNLYKDNLGNPHLPDKLKRRRRWKQTSGVSVRPVITPRWPNYVLTAVLLVSAVALAISFSVFYRRGSPAVARSSSEKAAAVGLAIAEKSIAVLPFENLSEEKANAYFADGVQDEILTYLAKIAALKVISRTSVLQYKSGVARNLREIAQQLGVANVVEGSVQRSGNRVRVNAQLVDARTDAHLWAQTYDRDLADVFAIQSEIAKAIAEQLQAKLSPNEKKAIEQSPTTDLAAFDLYSRAKSLLLTASFSVTQDQDRRKAIELLDEAVKRDPSFFDAYCQLAGAHEDLYAVSGSDHTPTRLALAEAALQAATRLRPDAAETHLARAQYLYYGLRDYAGALAELEIARRALPNDPRLFELTGYILRLRGQQEEGLQNLERAVELDPRNFNTLQQISLSYQYLGRYAKAIAALDRALVIVPDNVETRANRAEYELFWKADTRPLCQTIDAILAQGPGAIARAASSWFDCALAERDPAAAERALVALGDNPCWGEGATNLSRSFGEGLLARMTKDETRARTAFEAARAQQEKIVQGQPDYGPTLCVLGLIDAALGRKDLALDEGRRAIALMPVEKDVKNGSLVLQYFAITAAWAGEKELALQQLEAGLRAPTASLMLSYGALKLFPVWDPLRGDPRFEQIVTSLAPKKP
jgi:serine/threonine-protein kinase